jgi:hypothetical protein
VLHTRVARFANGAAGYEAAMGYSAGEAFPDLIDTMKRAAAALRDADVPAMLGGGLAVWARGGPPTEHDVDFYLRESDAERGLEALVAAGMQEERPPEGWLFKAHDGETLVDLIFRPSGGPIGDEHFQRGELLEVMAQPMLVTSLDDVLATKLLSLREQELDYGPVLELSRSLREQVDWSFVREQTDSSPFARAFFTLITELGIADVDASPRRPSAAPRDEGGEAASGLTAAARRGGA